MALCTSGQSNFSIYELCIKSRLINLGGLLLISCLLQINSATILLEKFTYTFIKLSVLFFYRRIFFQRKSFRIANSILIVLVTLWGLIFFLDEVIIGYDKAYLYRFAESQRWSLFWFGITDVLGDIAILTLPYPCIRKLQMSRRAKIGLTVVFLMGTL